ncbi:hypothetical protein GPALN_014846 [Globodera pallida]|nr:hypothetical protein GPALN_014846 [Globodera pallida]
MKLYFFFTLVLAKFTIIWPTDPLKRGELPTENLQNSRGFSHSTRSPFKQYPSTLVKQEINPEQAEEHNVSERSKQNVIGQHQLIEPKQEVDQQPTAPVAINAQIKTEPLEIETKLTLFNKQLTPKNEHLQLNTEEGTSGNMNGNLNRGKALALEEGEIDPSEEALLQGEKEREMGEEEASVQAENVQATEEEALKQGENATEMEKEALQQKEKALAIEEEEALLRKGKALALEEGEIEPSGTALLQEEQEREMGKENHQERHCFRKNKKEKWEKKKHRFKQKTYKQQKKNSTRIFGIQKVLIVEELFHQMIWIGVKDIYHQVTTDELFLEIKIDKIHHQINVGVLYRQCNLEDIHCQNKIEEL